LESREASGTDHRVERREAGKRISDLVAAWTEEAGVRRSRRRRAGSVHGHGRRASSVNRVRNG
jgi:hypothetical protein